MLESLEELRVFVQIAESGSLAGAARAMGMAPNTVSRRLAALEERLGAQLLYRTTRSLSVSDTGRAFLLKARRILQEVDAAEHLVLEHRQGLSGTVRVGVTSVLVQDLLSPLSQLLEQHSSLDVQLFVYDRPVNPITEGLDIVIIGGSLVDSTLVTRKLTDIHTILVASSAYLERYGTPQRPEDLRRHESVVFYRDPPQTTWVLHDAREQVHVVPLKARLEVNDGRTMMDALEAGMGIGLTSPRILARRPALRRILPDFGLGIIPVSAVYPASGPRSERLQAVLELIREALGDKSGEVSR